MSEDLSNIWDEAVDDLDMGEIDDDHGAAAYAYDLAVQQLLSIHVLALRSNDHENARAGVRRIIDYINEAITEALEEYEESSDVLGTDFFNLGAQVDVMGATLPVKVELIESVPGASYKIIDATELEAMEAFAKDRASEEQESIVHQTQRELMPQGDIDTDVGGGLE